MPDTLKHPVVVQHSAKAPHHPVALVGILVLFLVVVLGLLWAGRLRRRAMEQQASSKGKRSRKRSSSQPAGKS